MTSVGTDDVCPIAFSATCVKVEQQAGLDQLFVLAARVELGGTRRIAAEGALHDRRAGRFAERDGAVDPLVAGLVELLGELD